MGRAHATAAQEVTRVDESAAGVAELGELRRGHGDAEQHGPAAVGAGLPRRALDRRDARAGYLAHFADAAAYHFATERAAQLATQLWWTLKRFPADNPSGAADVDVAGG